MGAEQLAGVMEIIKRQSAASANSKVDEKQLKTEKDAIKKTHKLKRVSGMPRLNFGMMA